MDPRLLLLILACTAAASLLAAADGPFDYESAWQRIDQLQKDRLPKSMEAKVDSLYQAALAENRTDQQIRALIYKLRIMQEVKEFSSQQAIDAVREYLKTSQQPASAVLHSMLAELYWNYYVSNRWRFEDRGETVDFDLNDVAAWDLKTIAKETAREYSLSLAQPELLQKLSIADYPAFVKSGGKDERTLRPTLYDFLARRALAFYQNDESGLTLPPEEFTISDSRFFAPAASFEQMAIDTPDSLSLRYQAALLYQELIRFHLRDEDPSALAEADLDRLSYMYANCALRAPDTYYEDALRLALDQYAPLPAGAYAAYKLAELYKSRGDLYQAETGEDHRWDYVTALQLCDAWSGQFPGSYGSDCCSALAQNIRLPELNLNLENLTIPSQTAKALLSVKNLSGAVVKVYRIPHRGAGSYNPETFDWTDTRDKKMEALLKKEPLWSKSFETANEGDFRLHTFEIPLGPFAAGHYIAIAANLGDADHGAASVQGFSFFTCSGLSWVGRCDKRNVILVADRSTGLPLKGVQARLFQDEYNQDTHKHNYPLVWSGESDPEGILILPEDTRYEAGKLLLVNGADSLQVNSYWFNNDYRESVKPRCLLFTDRSIYRPGQTIYVKGVLYESDKEKKYGLLTGKEISVVFRDANWDPVASQTVSTNEYGTFNCTFTAPQGRLTGNMSIFVNRIKMPGTKAGSYSIYNVDGSVNFSVEEYKRPRFEVTLDKPQQSYKLDQYVSLRGRALSYAGFPVDSATVSYRIFRQAKYPFWYWWWGPRPDTPEKEIAHGTAATDSEGWFDLSFLAAGESTANFKRDPYFTFRISADVTDISGETRSGTLSLNVGEKELILNPLLADGIDLQSGKLSVPVETVNLSSEPMPARGELKISRLQAPDRVQKNRYWQAPDRAYLERSEFLKLFPNDIYGSEDQLASWPVLEQVWSGSFDTPDRDSLEVANFAAWRPGVYVLEANTIYKQQEIKVTRYFTVYDSDSGKLPYPQAEWFVPVRVVCEPGEEVQILIGSGYEDVSVLVEVEKSHAIVESRRIKLDRSQRLVTFPVKETDRGGFFVHFTFIRDSRLYTRSQEITVPWTDRQLSFEYMSFRDKLLPGQDQEWRLKLKDHTGGRITAEVLVSMYDASLDAFRPGGWTTGVYGKASRSCGWRNYSFLETTYLTWIRRYWGASWPKREFDSFNWYGYRLDHGFAHVVYCMSPDIKTGSTRVLEDLDKRPAVSDVANITALQGGAAPLLPEEPEDLSQVAARINFAETAFFYPELHTDEKGEVSFAFKIPEALTRWKFRALALTRDFKIGTSEKITVTQKPLMVLPNAPRFFREGDKITFTAKITSLDETGQSGTCQLFLFDAISLEPVDKDFQLDKARQSFSVRKGESTVLNWELQVPSGLGAVTYRVVARSGDFSDGEENTLPILSNRMLVTESLPLPVPGNSTKSFVFAKLRDSGQSTTLRSHKLTLEYTSNPAWYAVQALPYLMEYPHDCNEQIFSRFYANSLASHIANANPAVQRVFAAWRDTPGSAALLSNLQKNEELKSVLLQETPWVLEARNETQAKQRIGLLFDLNNMANQFDTALAKLKQNQSAGGGWPWFPGMNDSWWVTQYIVEGLGHLDHLGVTSIRQNKQVWQMAQAALGYIDRKILEDYLELQKMGWLELDNLGYMEMHYLYARSFFPDIPLPEDVSVAVEYFKGQADLYWANKDNFGQGLIALALHRFEKPVTPAKVIASLRERALHDEELGMWWKYDDTPWFWYQAPIETQSLLIEAFHDIVADTLSIDAMRTWLLKNKQTNHWKTTKATAEACYALLISGTEWLVETALATIQLGGETLEPAKMDGVQIEVGTGYFKTSWQGGEIKPKMAEVAVTNPNRVSSWGSLYWQYFEDLDKITPAQTPLRLDKALFVERLTDTGKVLDPVRDGNELKVGDKVVVRIELRSDRDLEYLHLKDMRASGFEPVNVLSRYKWQDGLGYYEATGDAATNFFIEYLPKGTYVFEYPLRVFNKGDFSNGIASIQCMYAPEFGAHSAGIHVEVE